MPIRHVHALCALTTLALLGPLVSPSAAQQTTPAPATPTTPTTPTTPAAPSPLKVAGSLLLVSETTKDGKTTEQLSDATKTGTLPGQLLQAGQKVQNVSSRTLRNVSITMPVDSDTVFQTWKCSSAAVKAVYSIDGKTFAAAPLKKKVKVTEGGREVEKEVEVKPSEYTHLRWQLPDLNAGDQIDCYIRVLVR